MYPSLLRFPSELFGDVDVQSLSRRRTDDDPDGTEVGVAVLDEERQPARIEPDPGRLQSRKDISEQAALLVRLSPRLTRPRLIAIGPKDQKVNWSLRALPRP